MKVVIIPLMVFANSLTVAISNSSVPIQITTQPQSIPHRTTVATNKASNTHNLSTLSNKPQTTSKTKSWQKQTTTSYVTQISARSISIRPFVTVTTPYSTKSPVTFKPVTATSTKSPVTFTSTKSPVTFKPVTVTSTKSPVTVTSTKSPLIFTSTKSPVTVTSTKSPVTPVTVTSTKSQVTVISTKSPVTVTSTKSPVTVTAPYSTKSPISTISSITSTLGVTTANQTMVTPSIKVPTTSTSDILTRYVKIRGMTSLYSTLTYMTISDVTACAAECDSADEEDFRCFSFDICADQKLCSLSPGNVTDPNLLTDSVGCDHYVRKEPNLKTYKLPDRTILGKYRRMSGQYNPYSTLTYTSISDVITCAAECDSADEEDFRCFSFDICAGKKLCSLSPENITQSNLLVDSADCDHYSRWYGDKEVTNEIIHIYPTKEPSKNTGTLVGLGLGMLAVGLLLGIGGIFLYNRYRNHKADGYELDNFKRY